MSCSFCGKSTREVGPLQTNGALLESRSQEMEFDLVADSRICLDCSKLATAVLEKRKRKTKARAGASISIPRPIDLMANLNDYIVGQQAAKKTLAVEIVNHYQRLVDNDMMVFGAEMGISKELQDVEIEKSNMLLIGPSGSGKTLLVKTIARELNVPVAFGDATTLTEAGYVGEDVENLILKLLHAADYNVEAAERGIVFIDEIDKLRSTSGNVSITRDVSGVGVQESLLKLIEGTVANVPPQGGRKHPEQQCIQVNTSNILFIGGGAFNGLEEIVKRRTNKKEFGFSGKLLQSQEFTMDQVLPEDLIQYGMIPELVGRLPVISTLSGLTVEDFELILTEPKNALIKQERKKCFYYGCDLQFTKCGIRAIAELAHKRNLGARGLRSVVASIVGDLYFSLTDADKGSCFVIDRNVVDGTRSLYATKIASAA